MTEKSFYGWKLLFVFWLIIVLNFAFPTFATSVVNTYMAKAMHLSRKELGLAFSVFSLMAGLPAPLVAKSINKFGIRFTLVVGTLLSSCGAFLMASFVKTTSEAIVIFGIVVGAGVALAGTLGPQVGAARWFHRKRARAMSLLAYGIRHRRFHRGAHAERDHRALRNLASGVVVHGIHVTGSGLCRCILRQGQSRANGTVPGWRRRATRA